MHRFATRAARGATAAVTSGLLIMGGVAAASPAAQLPTQPPTAAGQAQPPIRYMEVRAPVDPNKPGKGGRPTAVVYTPAAIRTAYGYPTFSSDGSGFAAGGAGQTIAIVTAFGDPTLGNDVMEFDDQFGLPVVVGTTVYPDGVPKRRSPGWAMETALDVEWAHVSAPYAHITLVVALDNTFQHLLDALDSAIGLGPAAISMSWGAPESNYAGTECTLPGADQATGCLDAYESEFTRTEAAGITFFSASGDDGANDGTPGPVTDYPSASPEVAGVGGTTLLLNSDNSWKSETAWSGSGGGYSAQFAEPDFQSGISESGCSTYPETSCRGVPDVAFDADPATGVYVMSGGRWYSVSGTSVGSPNWAAIAADGAAARFSITLPNLYGLRQSVFHDVISGSNGAYSAGTGWDPVTGRGSPSADLFPTP